MNRVLLHVLLFLPIVAACFAQGPSAGSSTLLPTDASTDSLTVAFYNLENLFDTVDAPGLRDGEFTPRGAKRWTSARYARKLADIAQVLSSLAASEGGFPAVVGVAEVENRAVMEDLIAQPALASVGYRMVHYDSPDPRGIDVGFLYRPEVLAPEGSAFHPFAAPGRPDVPLRGFVSMQGRIGGEPFFFLVCHWPSRVDGAGRSQGRRMAAAERVRGIVDSVMTASPATRIVVMGDLNDDPVDSRVTEGLRTAGRIGTVGRNELFNPFAALYLAGYGSLAYRGEWNLFDQILVSRPLTTSEPGTLHIVPVGGTEFYGGIFCRPCLLQTEGHFRGYPFRTYAGDEYLGGVSDHLPVYIRLERASAAGTCAEPE